ncbi:permease [Pasteurellaceae bacterium Pebbles2]|nr:permease [Pasteurellaceae bacterium Pebbles2]
MIKGVIFSLAASLLFGVVYFLTIVLQPVTGDVLFGWRTIVTLPFLFVLLYLLKQQRGILTLLQRIKKQPYLLLVLLFTSSNMAIQMWLFLWAPVNGKAIEVSIGYLLMPLMMVLIGRFFYREPMSKVKSYAVLFAAAGVLSKVIATGVFSWETALVIFGYPFYFCFRKSFDLLQLSTFVFEMILLLPVSIYLASQIDMNWAQTQNPHIYLWLATLGLVGGIAFGLYVFASQILPMNMLGLLGYAEPFFMLFVSFFIGERLNSDSYILMACLLIAVALLALDGWAQVARKKNGLNLPNG